MTAMVPLLSPMRIGPVRVRNRILSSGHGTVLVQDGSVIDDLTPGLRRPRAGPLHHACADGHRRRLHPGCPELAEAVHRHGTTIFGHGSGLQVQQEPDHLLGHRLRALVERSGACLGEAHAQVPAEQAPFIALLPMSIATTQSWAVRSGMAGLQVHRRDEAVVRPVRGEVVPLQ